MKLETSRRADITILDPSGEFNADSVGRFNEAVAEALADQRRDFVIDLAGVTTIDSAGLESLTAVQQQCEEQLGMVRLCGADPTLRKIFEITRLDKVFTLCDTRAEALETFAQT